MCMSMLHKKEGFINNIQSMFYSWKILFAWKNQMLLHKTSSKLNICKQTDQDLKKNIRLI